VVEQTLSGVGSGPPSLNWQGGQVRVRAARGSRSAQDELGLSAFGFDAIPTTQIPKFGFNRAGGNETAFAEPLLRSKRSVLMWVGTRGPSWPRVLGSMDLEPAP
jgi:hypothetical protein